MKKESFDLIKNLNEGARPKLNESDYMEIANKFGIADNIEKLKNDLLAIEGVTDVDFDLFGYYDGIEGVITLVYYDIDTSDISKYYSDKKALLNNILEVFKANGVTIENRETEDNDTYFYFVSYDTNWNSKLIDESALKEEVENNKYSWDNFEEYSDESVEQISNILDNLNFVAKTHEVTSGEGVSVAVEDTSTKMVFWLDFYKQGVDVVGEWNQYIFHKDSDDDMIREAIQSSYYTEYGDTVAYDDAESIARAYLEEKGFLTFNKETNEEELNTNISESALTESKNEVKMKLECQDCGEVFYHTSFNMNKGELEELKDRDGSDFYCPNCNSDYTIMTNYEVIKGNLEESALKEDINNEDTEEEDEDYDTWEEIEYWDGNLATEPDVDWREILETTPDLYREALKARERFVVENFEWSSLPNQVWELIDELLDEGAFGNPTDVSPGYMIDNMIVNGDFGDFDDYKDEDETDEEFIARAEDEAFRVYPEDRFVIWSL